MMMEDVNTQRVREVTIDKDRRATDSTEIEARRQKQQMITKLRHAISQPPHIYPTLRMGLDLDTDLSLSYLLFSAP